MEDLSFMQIYFAVASIATIAVFGALLAVLFYFLAILRDVRKLSNIARKEAEFIARSFAKGASILGTELSSEAAGFVRTIFALLLSSIGKPKARKAKKVS